MGQDGLRTDEIDTSRAHPARIYDYLLGGKDHFEVDRQAGEALVAAAPEVRAGLRANRSFLQRAVRHVTGTGVRQILDIGCGLPTSPDVHEIALRPAPDVRRPRRQRSHREGTGRRVAQPLGATGIVLADLRYPLAVVGHPEVRRVIDFDEPVALLLGPYCTSSRTPRTPRRSSPPCATRSRPEVSWCSPRHGRLRRPHQGAVGLQRGHGHPEPEVPRRGRAVLRRFRPARAGPGPDPVLAPGRPAAGRVRGDRLLRGRGPQDRLNRRSPPGESRARPRGQGPGGAREERVVTARRIGTVCAHGVLLLPPRPARFRRAARRAAGRALVLHGPVRRPVDRSRPHLRRRR